MRYIGPDYKTNMVINGVSMSPRDIPTSDLPYMMSRYPDLKTLFTANKEKVDTTDDKSDRAKSK